MIKIMHGNSLEVLKTLEDESIDCVVTSPPYWQIRDYGVSGQIGLESDVNEFLEKVMDIIVEISYKREKLERFIVRKILKLLDKEVKE